MSSSAGPASKLALKSSSVGPADKRGRAWDVADDVPPEEEEKSLADRVLTLGPVVEGVRAASEHPKLFDMVLYVTFLALLTYVTLQAQDQAGVWPSSAPYDSARMLHRRFGERFLKVDSVEQWFDYMEKEFLDIVYPLTWYSGSAIEKADLGFAGAGSNSPDNFRILGAVQVRQIRTQTATCPTTYQKELRNLVPVCVGKYSSYTQEQEPFGPLDKGVRRYTFSTSNENGESSYPGIFSHYDGGGYVTILPADGDRETKNKARAKIQQMRKDRWFDRQTRAVFVTVNLFNPSTGYLTPLRLILEHPAAGGLYPSVSLRHVPIGALYTQYSKLSTTLPEVLLTISVFLYVAWEFNEASKVTFVEYFSHFWGIYDWMNFALFIVSFAFRWAAYGAAPTAKVFPPANEKFVNLESSCWHVQMWRNLLAVTLIVAYLKLFKYIHQIPSLSHVFKKIFFTISDMMYLLLCFTFIFWGFSLSHFLAYGDDVKSFRTVPDTMIILWRQMFGDLDVVDEMVAANRILGPLFFVLFTSFVAIVLMTFFFGLLRESYVLADDQNNRITLVQSFLDSAIAPYLGFVSAFYCWVACCLACMWPVSAAYRHRVVTHIGICASLCEFSKKKNYYPSIVLLQPNAIPCKLK
jgi:polycystin 2